MPAITAVLHTKNDALRLGRALETLYPCDEILVLDHGSTDNTLDLARKYGARIVSDASGVAGAKRPHILAHGWILCLAPRESLTEALAASLFEWKSQPLDSDVAGFSVFLREETASGWLAHPAPETRLVLSNGALWDGRLPLANSSTTALEGELLRFSVP